MTRYMIEISGENPPLAAAEVAGAAEALQGLTGGPIADGGTAGLVPVDLPDDAAAQELARRLALAWRVLRPWAEEETSAVVTRFEAEGHAGGSIAIRPLGTPRGSSRELEEFGRSYRAGGGRVELERPDRRFFVTRPEPGRWWVGEEIAAVDRRAFDDRRLPRLPFRRPVSLPPRLGRVLVNLARVRRGDRVVDPFVGTGALLLEAALLGARVVGVDRDAEMVRGAMRNFTHLGLTLERAEVGDAATVAQADDTPFDAIVTDPPYGRSSGSGGEPVAGLLTRVIPAWADRVRWGGHLACVAPAAFPSLGSSWVPIAAVDDRVHRSLTRGFRAFRRAGSP